MLQHAAQEEVGLLIELSKVGAAMGLTEAINWIMSADYDTDYALYREKHTRGGKASFYLATVCDFYHSVGTLVKYGALNPELAIEYFEVAPLWDRVQGWIDGQAEDACGQVWPNFKYLGSLAEELAVASSGGLATSIPAG